ncbi:unnamed protein product [Candidula unifasciata]|uniref:POC1 centriolar protein A n=1 Tax=Candidula unifasciata TaxID=100452 RepID=A0A8S3YU73_9EUPU|nr:unnamed protein product [Candidula unifasciata]
MNKILQNHTAHSGSVNKLSFHASGNYLLTGSDDATLKIFDLLEGRIFYTLHGHQGPVTAVTFSTSGDYFASGGHDEQVLVWKTNFDVIREETAKTKRRRDQSCERPTVEDIPPRQEKVVSPRLKSHDHLIDAKQQLFRLDDVAHDITNVMPVLRKFEKENKSSNRNTDLENTAMQPLGVQLPQELTTFMKHVAGQLDILTQTVSLIEERLTITENKLAECLEQKKSFT